MKIALIGFTGFVGGNLAKQVAFDDGYNSQNIESIKGKKYDLIISAGTSSLRWKANQNPKEDWQNIKRLLDSLKEVKTKHFILISTIDVYPNTDGIDEDTQIDPSKLQPYGLHRYKMELFIKKNFPIYTIIRCPQLWGDNLKKNFVYDLIFDNALDFTHKDTVMQWYNLKNLWKDIQTTIKNDIQLINFATQPISAKELAKFTRNLNFKTVTEKPPMIFNFLTKYGRLFGSKDKYLYHKKEILRDLKKFINKERKKL